MNKNRCEWRICLNWNNQNRSFYRYLSIKIFGIAELCGGCYTPGLEIIRLLTCIILSKFKHGRLCCLCSWLLRGVRWRGDTAKTFVGGLIDRSKDDNDVVDDADVSGLSHEIRMFSMPRLSASTKIKGVVERCWCESLQFRCALLTTRWPRFGFNASKGGDVLKLTGMLWWWYGCDSRNCLT